MNDTPSEVTQRVRELMAKRSGAERLAMASSMFDTARRLMLASMPDSLTPAERRTELLRRTYPELPPFTKNA
jgi:hypothetical protein